VADYEVSAELVINARNAASGLNSISSKLGSMGTALRGTSGVFTGMVGQAIAFGGAYLGVSAMVGGFTRLASSAFEFQREVGSAQLGLQSIMGQVEGITDAAGNWSPVGFAEAERLSSATYQNMQDMAIESSATSAELLGIFNGIYGASRSAGTSMAGINTMTQNAATAAAALGIDFQQASRDMGAMMRGGAGMDVKLFQSLRSMNAITADAQEFNALAPEERIAMLSHALSGFEDANAAYGRSLPGALSTTTDLFQLFRGAFFGPAFARMAELLNDLNTYLIANKDAIKGFLTKQGEKFRDFLDAGVTRARAAFAYVSSHWDEIIAKVHHGVEEFKRLAPIVMEWGATFVKMRIAATALGIAFQAGSWMASAGAGMIELSAAMTAAAGGGAAAAGGAAAGAAGGAAGASVGAALLAAVPPLALLAAGAVMVWQAFDTFGSWLEPLLASTGEAFAGLGADLMEILGGLWDYVQPIWAAVGAVLAGSFMLGLKTAIAAIRLLLVPIRGLAAIIGWVGNNVIKPAFEGMANAFGDLVTWIGQVSGGFGSMMTKIRDFLRLTFGPTTPPPPPSGRGNLQGPSSGRLIGGVSLRTYADTERELERRRNARNQVETTAAPQDRTQVTNDFRGSRINVEQSFREADPDRVAIRMIEDITRFAEQRVQSGFAPAFTR